MTPDLEPDSSGGGRRLRHGTVRDRLPSLGDREMCQGRKSQAHPPTRYQRYVLTLRGSTLAGEAAAQPANQPEHEALETLWPSLAAHGQVQSLVMDRAYLSSPWIGALKAQGIDMIAKPWPLRNGGRFTKEAFQLALDCHGVTYHAGMTVPLRHSGYRVQFPAETCGRCALRATHRAAEGRKAFRQRTDVEHT